MFRLAIVLAASAFAVSCGAAESADAAAPVAFSAAPTSTTPAPVSTDGTLPVDADRLGWVNTFARCVDGERLVLLLGTISDRAVTRPDALNERIVVCENAVSKVRVMRASSPFLRPGPLEGTFFTFTANSQQFVADGMKIDLARGMVTVTDDPQRPDLRARSVTISEYWSAAY